MAKTITLRCPSCGRTQPRTKRSESDPPKAVIRELDCPKHGGGWRIIKWFDNVGNQLSSSGHIKRRAQLSTSDGPGAK